MLKMTKKIGDRNDGYRIRNVEPFFLLIPFIMKTRVDSQVFFTDEIDVATAENFVREHRDDIPGLSLYHIVIASLIRTYSQRPYLNRFVKNRRIYARDHLEISMVVKRGMSIEDEETTVKPQFSPFATLYDVAKVFNDLVEQNKEYKKTNGTDATAKIIGHLPRWLCKFVVGILNLMDEFRGMPKIINNVSPFHTSCFITNMGSLGAEPIYHHIYELGTTSLFIAMGKKNKQTVFDADGNPQVKKTIGINVVADERICNGHYYAESFKMFKNYMTHPERLLETPESITLDAGVAYEKRKFVEIIDGKKVKKPIVFDEKIKCR